MGNIHSCEPNYDINSPKKELHSIKNIVFQNEISLNNKIKLKESKKTSKTPEVTLDNKLNKKFQQKKKDSSKSKDIESYMSYISYPKNNSNRNRTNSYNSLTTNNNSKNIMNNKLINTTDNTKNITISEEDTITNQNSIDYINNFDLKNYKYNKFMKLKKKNNLYNNKINNNISNNTNIKNQINVINEENEDSKINECNNKNKRNKNLYIFSSDSESLNSNKQHNLHINNYVNINSKRNKTRNICSSKLSPQVRVNNIYKKMSCFDLKTNIGKQYEDKKPIYTKIKNDRKVVKLDLDESNISNINENPKVDNYIFSELITLKKCPSYKNEINIIKNLEITKKNQENEIKLLKEKVNSLCNIIEDNKNFKEKIIKKKDKLISYLQNEKIKNENIIKKLKTQLKKEKAKDNKDINKNFVITKNNTKINKYQKNNDNIKTKGTLNNKNNKEVISNMIYEKKNYQKKDNLNKEKAFRQSIPFKINIDLANNITIPLIKYKNETYELKNKAFTKNNFDNNKKLSSNDVKGPNINNENMFCKTLKKNVSDFNEKFNKFTMSNLLYIPKKSKFQKKYVLCGNNKEGIRVRSNSITNLNKLVLKIDDFNIQEKKEQKNDKSNKETISLNGTNFFCESINKKEDISMSLNLSPITKNYSKNLIQSIEDNSMNDLFKTKKNNENNINREKQNYIYKNKLKIDNIDIGLKTKNKLCLSPNIRKSSGQIINKQNNYFYAKDYFNLWKISFIILNEKVNINSNKDTLLSDVIDTLINKIKQNSNLYKKFSFVVESKDNLIFLANNKILNKSKTLEGNKLGNNSKIFIILEL